MISKERLEELVKEEKGCYVLVNAYTIGYIHLNKKYEPKIEPTKDGYNLWVFTSNEYDFRDCIDDYKLFETKEDAEWELEMTATRTETLKMPKWEEAQDEKFHFSYLINVKGLHLYISIYNFTKKFEIYCNHGTHTDDYKFDKTFDLRDKEQYETACKLCLKLFKGEEV